MADFYVKSGAGAIVYANRTWSNGEKMVPVSTDATTNFAVARKAVWEVTTPGVASGATTPTWPAAVTYDVTTVSAASGATVWTARKPGFSSGATPNWAFATIYLAYAVNASVPGDRIFVSNNHAESTTGIAWSFNGGIDSANQIQVLCVSDAATPPTTLALTGTVTNQTTGTMVFLSPMYVYGLTITNGSGGTGGSITINNASTNLQITFDHCNLRLGSSAANSIAFGTGTGGVEARLLSTSVRFGATTQRMSVTRGVVQWDSGGVESGGTSPAALWNSNISAGSQARVETNGVDLSTLSTTCDLIQAQPLGSSQFSFYSCDMPNSWTGNLWSAAPTFQGATGEMIDCVAATASLPQRWYQDIYGSVKADTTVYALGGASDGTVGYGWNMTTSASPIFPLRPLASPVGYLWNASVSAQTATVLFIANTATMPTNAELTLELVYMSISGSPSRSVLADAAVSTLASATGQSAATTDWTGGAAARANTTVYTAGQSFKVASNPTRLFFVTTGGTSTSPEPAGYATAVDGDSVSDGGAMVARAGWRGSLSIPFTAAVAGTLRWTANVYKTSATVYVDPFLTLT